MEGRRAGTEGERLAADYIKSQFQSIGLTPLTPRYYQSFSTPLTQDSLDSQKNSLTAKNVIGFIDNDKEQTIVIGAHYDHLGRGFHALSREAHPEDQIHYGADDNASGLALMLNLADYFENNEVVELTNFVFIAFSAEEIGLIGSKFWCENSGFDLKSIKAMINLDMVGRLDPSTKELFVFGIGTSNRWDEVLEEHNTKFKLIKDSSGVGPSDHASFYLENIPAVHLFTGQHSFAYAQHDGKWLILGGRLDGIHARQPFNAFPENQNNKEAFVIDYENHTFWSVNLDVLPVSIFEQMQSTNMNFYQVEDTLYFIGGYAYSNTEQDHITFPSMTTIIVSEVINAIMNAGDITPFFKQIDDDIFALTGGQMGKMDGKLMIIGGHRFDGRYNPMGHATYVQSYSNAIRTFEVNNAGTQLSFSNYSEVIDPVHLRRRDYNLLPQIFEDATMGYTISSGVFQETIDLPFLYPVDIKPSGHTPSTSFNQYLSNYHGSKVAIHDAVNNQTHNLFFGGMSQYYYDNGTLVQDDQVPFVKTISRLSRYSDGSLQEFVLPVEMPALKGASSEFIMNLAVPHH